MIRSWCGHNTFINIIIVAMGLMYQGINGPFSGRVGAVIGYLWKGKPCVRAYRQHINYPNTVGQQQQRDWFISMVRFAGQAKQALRMGLRQRADDMMMTECNYFVMRNKAYFNQVNGSVEVDYSRIQLSEGSATDVYFHEPHFLDSMLVTVGFEKNGIFGRASGNDLVYLYAYAPSLGEGYLSGPAERRNKVAAIRLPDHWDGQEVHIYGFVIDRTGAASCTTYIGVGCVARYAERGRYVPTNRKWTDFVDIANEANADSVPEDAEARDAVPLEKPVVDIFGNPPDVP